MRGPYTSNGLQLVYTGEFIGDFAADNVIDISVKFNNNMVVLDAAITEVKVLKVKMLVLEARGHLAGLINGGTTGTL